MDKLIESEEKTCDCRVCKRHSKHEALIAAMNEQDRKYAEWLYEELNYAEMDRDYYKSRVEGKWPATEHAAAAPQVEAQQPSSAKP